MNKVMKALVAAMALTALAGCGASPTAAHAAKRTVRPVSAPSAKTATRTQPKVSSHPTTSSQKPRANQPAAEAPANRPQADGGELKLKVALTGNAPVTHLAVKVYEQTDPTLAMDLPLELKAGVATWSQADVPPGRYTFQVRALGAMDELLGSGNTETIVKAGEVSEVSLELRANLLGAEDTSEPPAEGAVLDLNITIL